MSQINAFYQQRIEEYGLGYQTMWGDSDTNIWKATERFKIIEAGDMAAGDTLFDLGAGIGLLKENLDQRNIPVQYTAVDAVETFLDHVKNTYQVPTIPLDFFNEIDALPGADWYGIFGSINKKWLLGIADEEGVERVYEWLERCFAKTHKGIFMSCFSDRTNQPKAPNVHLNPATLIEQLGSAVQGYRIRHDTGFYEFTFMARK